jgi:hypothetical protein
VVNAQLCARSTSSHLRRTPTCGYVDNASALPTDPQDQKTTKVSVNLIALKAQHSDPVHHHPDRQAGQPRHPSPHSVSILAAIHSFRPAQILAMRDAFQKACKAPQVADGTPDVTEGVARRILELAKAGETSPDRLCTGALRKLSH